jgi:3-hydroxybutyrate dehydrogenase
VILERSVKKVLITGGTGSVGQALVETFAKEHSVTFQYHQDSSRAQYLQSSFGAKPLQMDFTQDPVLPELDFDIVINNAGINISDIQTHQVSVTDWNRTLQVNLNVPFHIIRQCIPSMIPKRWGRIINISSIYALRAVEGNLPYTVSKHGLTGLTKTVAKEYAIYGITCNEICPGPIQSQMMKNIAVRSSSQTGGAMEDYLKEVENDIPAKRMAEPQEVAALALFLASQAAAYLTGASIPLDGGMIQ